MSIWNNEGALVAISEDIMLDAPDEKSDLLVIRGVNGIRRKM